jgi:hypothetical protein
MVTKQTYRSHDAEDAVGACCQTVTGASSQGRKRLGSGSESELLRRLFGSRYVTAYKIPYARLALARSVSPVVTARKREAYKKLYMQLNARKAFCVLAVVPCASSACNEVVTYAHSNHEDSGQACSARQCALSTRQSVQT